MAGHFVLLVTLSYIIPPLLQVTESLPAHKQNFAKGEGAQTS